MNTNLRDQDVRQMTLSSKNTHTVEDTNMLKGEAQNSLTGKNTTKPDSRNMGKSDFGKIGGLPMASGG